MLDEEKMKCLIIDCTVALRRIQRKKEEKRKDKINSGREQYTSANNRVFVAAVSMILDDNESLDTDPALANLLLPFPNKNKMTDGRSWLSLHFALALGRDKVKDAVVRLLYSHGPLAIQQHHLQGSVNSGFTPGHLLCM
jgi:hypothetical protein